MGGMKGSMDIRALLESAAGRYRSVRIAVLHRLDLGAYGRGLPRFKDNPNVASLLERGSGDPWRQGIRQEARRMWFRHPAFHREEVYTDRAMERLVALHGGDGDRSWSYDPRRGKVRVWSARSIGTLVRRGERPIYGREALAGGPPVVAHWFHPIVGELLQPAELLEQELSLEVLGHARHLEREVLRVRARLGGWAERREFGPENLPPADEHEFLVDAATGVLLRVANRFDGEDFSVREVLEVAFDEEIPPETFEPPTRP